MGCNGGSNENKTTINKATNVETPILDNENEPVSLLHLERVSEMDFQSLQLVNLSTGDVVATFDLELEVSAAVSGITTIENGYFAVEIMEENEAVEFMRDTDGTIVGWSQMGVPSLRFLILDETLSVVDDIVFSDNGPEFSLGLAWRATADGFDVFFQEEEQFLTYNTATGKAETLFPVLEGMWIDKIAWVDENRLFFTASLLDDESNRHYGIINLVTNDMNILLANDFDAVSFDFVYPHMLLQEHGEALFRGEQLRNEVLILDVTTGMHEFVPLGNEESMHAILSLDGQYIVTTNEARTQLRKYSVADHELVLEVEISPQAGYDSWHPDIMAVGHNRYRLNWISDDTQTSISEMVHME